MINDCARLGHPEAGRCHVRGSDPVISVSHNFDAAERMLSDFGRTQLPFATALALNDTAADVSDAVGMEMRATLDRPTPFTLRGFYTRRASKGRLTAEVGAKDVQAGYLRFAFGGGVRRPERAALLVPVAARLNSYGNLPRRAVARLVARGDVFATSRGDPKTRHLRPGIYRRPQGGRGGPQLLIAFEDSADYRQLLDLVKIAGPVVSREFEGHLLDRLRRVLASG